MNLGWIYIFKEIINNGTWLVLSTNNAKALYPVINAYVNWQGEKAMLPLDVIQHKTGLTRTSVIKGIKELEELELLKKDHSVRGRSIIIPYYRRSMLRMEN